MDGDYMREILSAVFRLGQTDQDLTAGQLSFHPLSNSIACTYTPNSIRLVHDTP